MNNHKFIINGGKRLEGVIEVGGAKNSALKSFAAALLTEDTVNLKNIPEVEDIIRMKELVEDLNVSVKKIDKSNYHLNAGNIKKTVINPEIAKRLRASIVLTGPILARSKKVSFPHPGGCVIGERPIDVFIDGYKSFGAKISFNKNLYTISAPKLKGAKFYIFEYKRYRNRNSNDGISSGRRKNNLEKLCLRTGDRKFS